MFIEFGTGIQKARPFLKWAGGKTQLLDEIDSRLPKEEIKSGLIDTYIEPFVGGGALFFHVVQKYSQFQRFLLFDINQDLVNCYNAIKDDVYSVVSELKRLERRYLRSNEIARKVMFYRLRDEFNLDRSPAKMIFLNKTCYNGLYRVNRNNEFNVPFGSYKNPTICDEENLVAVSTVLKNTDIISADFEESERHINEHCFVYLDPPYRPISSTASFTSYARGDFSETDQIRLADFCKRIKQKGAKFLLSNSDPKNEDPNDCFFEKHFSEFRIERVKASRAINCIAEKRGAINEILVTNH
jgi:DNA adenine methylase